MPQKPGVSGIQSLAWSFEADQIRPMSHDRPPAAGMYAFWT